MTSRAQRRLLIGKESTPGDGATVDVALRPLDCNFKAVVDKRIAQEYTGSFASERHYIASERGEGSFEIDYYEHVSYPLSMALGAGSVVFGEWTFELAKTSPPTFATYNLEYTDGGNHIVKVTDVFATGLEISGEAGGAWRVSPTLVGGNVTYPAAVGASPAIPGTATPILMSQTTFNLGGPDINDILVSFVWKLENYQHQKQFAGSLYPTGRGNNKWKVTLELLLEVAKAEVETLKDRLFTLESEAIYITSVSPDAGQGFDYVITIEGCFGVAQVDTMDERDGNNLLKVTCNGLGIQTPGNIITHKIFTINPLEEL